MSFQLSTSEKLLIYRLRKGLSQKEMAEKVKIPYRHYLSVEKGFLPENKKFPAYVMNIAKLSNLEECIILRKRSKLSQLELGKELGVSRQWVNEMEKGKQDAERLLEFWRTKNVRHKSRT
jgi:DNA-binding XRE family transcriptional regulator